MKILENNFVKNAGVLVGGTSASQLLLILGSPILTRLYTPEDFGVLAVYAAIVSLLVVLAGLRYELAIPLPEDEDDAINLVVLAELFVVGVSSVTAAFLMIFGKDLVLMLGVSEVQDYLWMIPVGVLFMGTYQVFNYLAIRKKNFGNISKTRIIQSICTLAVQFYAFKLSGLGLVAGQTAGQAVGIWGLSKHFIKNKTYLRATREGVLQCAKRYRDFPLFSTWAGFANVAGTQLPPLLFSVFFTSGAVGLYALAHRVMAAPMAFVGQAVGSVFLSEAPERYRKDALAPFLLNIHKKLVYLILGPVLTLLVFGPNIFSFVFGEEWRVAGEAARWLSLWMMVSFTTSPLSSIYEIVERQRLGMLMQFQLLVARCVGITFGAISGDFMLAIICFALSNVVSYIIYLLVLFKVIGGNPVEILLNYMVPFLAVIVIFGVDGFEIPA